MHETKSDKALRIRPLKDKLLVDVPPEFGTNITDSGIWVATLECSEPELTVIGTVLEVGSGHRLDNGEVKPLDFKPGDKVLLKRWDWNSVHLDGKEYFLVRADSVLAKC